MALQDMSTRKDIPFAQYLAPSEPSDQKVHIILPPAYTLGNFRFNLDSLVGKDNNHLTLSTTRPYDAGTLQDKSTLDKTQSETLINALKSSLALIQDPPGTGKSYTGVALIKVLLENRKLAHMGPIICVCYTNHALDQLLMSLVEHGVEQIVRVSSRSKEEALAAVNLRHITSNLEATKAEKHKLWQSHTQMDEHLNQLNTLVELFRMAHAPESIMKFLEVNYPHHAMDLFNNGTLQDEDGWQEVTQPAQVLCKPG